jgi:RHS repeat-associated protein
MTYDPSKKITVSYNPLNLPRLVEFDNSDFIEYTYTATGTKLRKTVTSWKTTTGGTTDYAGQFLYQDNELSCIFTPVGRIVPMQYNDEIFWKHEYNLKDYLGNTRIVFAAHPHGQPELMQQTSYYPFGMTLQQQNFGGLLNQPNKLLYNGKELQDDELAGVSLDWYDYGARMYDAQIGRWHVVDPLAEERKWLSPYNYVQNNPIMRIDPDGALDDEWNLNTETGEMTWVSHMGGDEVQFVNFVTPHENGAMEWHGTTSIDGADIFSGPMANNYNGDFTFGVSNKDLWSDIPNVYQGHYMAWDLKLRYVYSNKSNQTQINSIRSQEAMGLDRREMIWNSSDEYRRIVNKYGTDASFVMAHEYGMMPLPVGRMGAMSYTQRSLALGRSSYFKGVSGTKGSNFFKNIAVYSTQPKLSNNPWIRFLQMNKGQYSGKGWLNTARQDYYNLKAAGGL